MNVIHVDFRRGVREDLEQRLWEEYRAAYYVFEDDPTEANRAAALEKWRAWQKVYAAHEIPVLLGSGGRD